jgi:hypothetical protein
VTTLTENQAVGPAEVFWTPFVNVEGCDTRMVLFATRSAGAYFDNWITFGHSSDGVASYNTVATPTNPFPGFPAWSQISDQHAYLDVTGNNTGPYVTFGIDNGLSAQDITIQLYCR